LGKNGEPKPKVSVNLTLMSRLDKKKKEVNLTLITNKDGMINLGHLKHVLFIDLRLDQYNVSK